MNHNSKTKMITYIILLCFIISVTVVPAVVYSVKGNISGVSLPDGFTQKVQETVYENNGDVRIMSSNLLAHYESWGGSPAKPRAKMYCNILEAYKPDVIGVQEMCDSWYSLLRQNLPDGYKMLYPFTSGAFVRMTAMIYNSNNLYVIDSGNFSYKKHDNPRLRRVVWAVFEMKSTGKRFAVTNTHFDLLREGREQELSLVMRSQAQELTECIDAIYSNYNCPVFAVGDFNAMEDTDSTDKIDIPEIYNTLSDNFKDTKFCCENQLCGKKRKWTSPSYDHIFMKGDAEICAFTLMSYGYLSDMSDHYPIFADVKLK